MEDGEELELQLWSVTYLQFSASLKILEKTGNVRGSRAMVFEIWQLAVAGEDCCFGLAEKRVAFQCTRTSAGNNRQGGFPAARNVLAAAIRSNDHGSRPRFVLDPKVTKLWCSDAKRWCWN